MLNNRSGKTRGESHREKEDNKMRAKNLIMNKYKTE